MLVAIYEAFLGVLLAAFVGVGISVAYPEPRFPTSPLFIPEGPSTQLTPEQLRQREEFQRVVEEHRVQSAIWSRNVSAIAAIGAVALLALSLTVLRRTPIFSDGFLLGGLLTFLYSVMRGASADDSRFLFVVVALGVAIALALGYVRFLKNLQPKGVSS